MKLSMKLQLKMNDLKINKVELRKDLQFKDELINLIQEIYLEVIKLEEKIKEQSK